jgi:asparagine synthase (glutamine-hydrolysing)
MAPSWLLAPYRRLHKRGWASWEGFSMINPEFARRNISILGGVAANRGHLSSRPMRSEHIMGELQYDQDDFMATWLTGFGVELRDPTRVKALVEFCLSIPDGQFLRNGEMRSLVRRAMRGRLPPQVTNNTQRGMQALDWFEGLFEARPQIMGLLDQMERSDLARSCLDVPRMRGLIEAWPARKDWGSDAVTRQYRSGLVRGLTMGRFLLWCETQ